MRSLLPVLGLLISTASHAETLYVSSLNSDEVLRYDGDNGQYIDTFITAGSGGLSRPHAILDRCNDLLVCSFGTDNVLRYDRTTGAFLDVLIDPSNGLDEPTYMIEGPDARLYVSSQGSDEIHRYTQSGAFVDVFVNAGSGGLDGPSGFAFGPDGRLYVAGRYSADVIAYDGATGTFDEVIADATDGLGAGDTFGLNFGDNGDLYVASNGSVFRYDLDTASIIASIPFSVPIGIESTGVSGAVAIATANNLRFIDTTDDSISAPFLAGATINTLNFFHYAQVATDADCTTPASVPATTTWGVVLLGLVILTGGTFLRRGQGRFAA